MARSEIYNVHRNVVVPAGGSREIGAVGSYVSVLESTLDFNIGIEDDALQFITQGLTIGTRDGSTFNRVRIENPNPGAITLTLAFGIGEIRDSRLSATAALNLTKASNLTTVADVSCANAAATQVIAVNTTRRRVLVQNLDIAATLRVGDSSVTAARGHRLGPGETLELQSTEAVFVRNDSGAAVLVSIVEEAD